MADAKPARTAPSSEQLEAHARMAEQETAKAKAEFYGGPPPAPKPAGEWTPPPPALPENRMRLVQASETDFANLWGAITTAGTPFERVTEETFWSHCAARLKVCDIIEVHTDDRAYFGRLYVRGVSAPGVGKLNNRATVAVLEHHEFAAYAPSLPDRAFKCEWKGPHIKWCVIRTVDSKIMSESHHTREEAETKAIAFARVAA